MFSFEFKIKNYIIKDSMWISNVEISDKIYIFGFEFYFHTGIGMIYLEMIIINEQ